MAGGPVRIAVASGKGGTGKTTVATSLALSLLEREASRDDSTTPPPTFLDCDVEGPNAHLFLAPTFERSRDVMILLPQVDPAACIGCGRCAEVCEYSAIVLPGDQPLVLAELCHGCGSCTLECPTHAISEVAHVIGVLEAGTTPGGMPFARGVLDVGQPMATPAIRQLKRWVIPHVDVGGVVILDVPPGTSCPVVEALRGADFVLLVTEPTPFGLHDLRLAAEVTAEMGIPTGVVVNRDGIGDGGVDDFCAAAGLAVLLRIPFDRAIAEGVARARPLVDIRPEYGPRLRALADGILRRVRAS